jgi:hypothetical protein
MTTQRPSFMLVQAAVLVLSMAFMAWCNWAMARDPALRAAMKKSEAAFFPALLIANGSLLLFSLTRLLTPASYDRALALSRELGLAPEILDGHFAKRDQIPQYQDMANN